MTPNRSCALVLSLILVAACEEQSVLGEQRCSYQLAPCAEPNVFMLTSSKQLPTTASFDVVASSILSPRWKYDLPDCSLSKHERETFGISCSNDVSLVAGPLGGVWLVNRSLGVGSAPNLPMLTQLSSEGALVFGATPELPDAQATPQTVASDGAGGVLMVMTPRDTGTPQAWQRAHLFRMLADGSEQTIALQPQETGPNQPALDFSSLALLSDGSMRVHGETFPDFESQTVWSFDAEGQLQWRRDDYVSEQSLPYSWKLLDLHSSSKGAAMPSGGYAFMAAFPTSQSPATGIMVIDAQGKLRWAAGVNTLTDEEPAAVTAFAVNQAGQLAITQGDQPNDQGFSSLNGDLRINALDADGNYVTRFSGRRHDYASVSADKVVVDAEGNIFTVLFTGTRDQPVPTVCKLRPGTEPSAECASLELCSAANESMYWNPGLTSGRPALTLASPEAGALVIGIAYGCADAEQIRLAIASKDMAAHTKLNANLRGQVIRVDM